MFAATMEDAGFQLGKFWVVFRWWLGGVYGIRLMPYGYVNFVDDGMVSWGIDDEGVDILVYFVFC